MMEKPKVATVWLEGCSGCHMSFLDLDEGLLDVLAAVDLTVTPVTDYKDYDFPEAALGIIEGAVGNEEQEEVLLHLRKKCGLLMAWGDCAVFGGINTMRNHLPVDKLLKAAYLDAPGTVNGVLPNGPEIPRLLPRVKAANEVTTVDIYIPGCPPSPEVILFSLKEILQGRKPSPPPDLIHFD